MNVKKDIQLIINSLNNLMGKIDSVDEPKPATDFTTGNNAFKHLQQPKYPEGILTLTHNGGFIDFKDSLNDYQGWLQFWMSIKGTSIHSVKNSKGEVFTVGDEVIYKPDNSKFKIWHFGFTRNNEGLDATNYQSCFCPIDDLTKSEKQQPSWKDQIVAFRNKKEDIKYVRSDNGWFDCHTFPPYVSRHIDYLISRDEVFEIFTVKNKAGVEFSVGDEVYNEGTNERFTIKGFQKAIGFREDLMVYERKDCIYSIEFLTKAEPKKEPLFKTEDGFEYELNAPNSPNFLYGVSKYNFFTAPFSLDNIRRSNLNCWYFKEKSNAERFVAENKKSISYKELEKFLDTNYVGAGFLYEDIDSRRRFRAEILNHFKPK